MKKIILMGVICGLMLSVSGCNTSDNKEKAVRYITEKKSVEKTETTTETKDYKKLINTVYAQLGNNDKKSVVNINEAKVKKINIKSEKNIALVDKNKKQGLSQWGVSPSVRPDGLEVKELTQEIIDQTDDAILGDLVVYVDASNNKIIAYGLRD